MKKIEIKIGNAVIFETCVPNSFNEKEYEKEMSDISLKYMWKFKTTENVTNFKKEVEDYISEKINKKRRKNLNKMLK